MKFARFEINGWQSYAVVEGDQLRVIQGDLFGQHHFTDARYPICLLYTSPSPRDRQKSRMPSSA